MNKSKSDIIGELIKSLPSTNKEIARHAGISMATVTNFKLKKNCSFPIMQKICEGFGIKMDIVSQNHYEEAALSEIKKVVYSNTTDLYNAFITIIRDWVELKGMSYSDIAAKTQKYNSRISEFFNEDRHSNMDLFLAIIDAVGLNLKFDYSGVRKSVVKNYTIDKNNFEATVAELREIMNLKKSFKVQVVI